MNLIAIVIQVSIDLAKAQIQKIIDRRSLTKVTYDVEIKVPVT